MLRCTRHFRSESKAAVTTPRRRVGSTPETGPILGPVGIGSCGPQAVISLTRNLSRRVMCPVARAATCITARQDRRCAPDLLCARPCRKTNFSGTCASSVLVPLWPMVSPSQQLPADEIARCGDDQGRDRIPSDHEERAVIGAVCRIEGRCDAACPQAGDRTRQTGARRCALA